MPSMASVTLIGHLGATPDVYENRSRFRVAVNTRRGGEKITTWYDVTVWGKASEWLAEKVSSGEARQGSTVLVQGEIEARPWTGKDGSHRVSLDVNASKVLVIGSASAGNQGQSASEDWGEPPF